MESERIIHLISRTRDRINREMSALMAENEMGDIAPAHAGMIYALGAAGAVPMSELARLLERDNSTITTLAEKLKRQGYLRKSKSPTDSRSFVLELTEQGQLARERIIRISRKLLRRFYRGMSGPDQQNLVRLLHQAYRNFD